MDEILTKDDLRKFEERIFKALEEFKTAFRSEQNSDWMKAKEVKQMLHCSDSSLATYRNNGSLPFTRFGKTYYYSRRIVNNLFEQKINSN